MLFFFLYLSCVMEIRDNDGTTHTWTSDNIEKFVHCPRQCRDLSDGYTRKTGAQLKTVEVVK